MAKFNNIKPGDVLFTVTCGKAGNTTISTVRVHRVRVISVDADTHTVVASWNGNSPQTYYPREVSKWRVKEPITVTSGWSTRLATRDEIKAIRARGATKPAQGVQP